MELCYYAPMLDPEKTGHAKTSALDAIWLRIMVFPVLQDIFGAL
jgi:hypothetical protein